MPYVPGRYHRDYQTSGSRWVGIGFVIVFHIIVIYGLVNGLARKALDIVHGPIETKILDQVKPDEKQPPPPPPKFTEPPPPFVPPPEINIETPAPSASTAITDVTHTRPVAPPAPKATPVRVEPHVDRRRSHEPDYPPTSRRLGEEGTVTLEVLVNEDGRAIDSKLVQSSGYPRLDEAALEEVKRSYRFTPGTVDGKPAQMWYTFRFVWRLR